MNKGVDGGAARGERKVWRMGAGRRGNAWARFVAILGIAAGLACPASAPADDAPDPRERAVGAEARAAVVESVAVALAGWYVFPGTGEELAGTIRRRNGEGAYGECRTLFALAQRLTEDLREESGDGHLRLVVRPDAYFEPAGDDTITGEETGRIEEEEAYENFGFLAVERLDGNVGYLRMNGFYDARRAGPTAEAAMAFLARTDAVIVDLRLTLGGSPTMDQLLASFFFDEPTRLSAMHRRAGDSTEVKQLWTQPFAPGADLSGADLFILVSPQTPSAAEAFAYDMKHLGRATIVGDTTAGAAHPCMEHVFPDLNLSLDVPFARMVHPVTGTDWEGTGVIPDVAAPPEEALDIAHLAALERIRDRLPGGKRRAKVEWALGWVRGKAAPARLDREELEAYAGDYGPRRFRIDGGRLAYRRGEGKERFLVAIGGDVFLLPDIYYVRFLFERNDRGEVAAVVSLTEEGPASRYERER